MSDIPVDNAMLLNLVYLQNFGTQGDILAEQFSVPNSTDEVLKFCSKADHSNVVVRVKKDVF